MVERVNRVNKDGQPATYADLEALPDHLVGEIVGGRLVARPRPAPAHARSSSALGWPLEPPSCLGRDGPGGWCILDEPEPHLGPDVLVPDLAGWRLERMPKLPETAYFELVPDWVCGVLSPHYESHHCSDMLWVYRREQVPHAWLVIPPAQTLEVLCLTPEGYLIVGVQTAPRAVRAEPFSAVELDLGLLFGKHESPEPPGNHSVRNTAHSLLAIMRPGRRSACCFHSGKRNSTSQRSRYASGNVDDQMVGDTLRCPLRPRMCYAIPT